MLRWALVFVLVPSVALADVISGPQPDYPPPDDCPPGSRAMAGGHGVGYGFCLPANCEGDADCGGEAGACRSFALCLQTRGGGHVGDIIHALGDCASCDAPAECSTAMRCANQPQPNPAPPEPVNIVVPPEPATGCACRAGAHASGVAAIAILLGLLAALRARSG